MTAPRADDTGPRAIAVTGASGYIGKRLVEGLLEQPNVERILGVDLRPSSIEDERYIHLQQDVRAPLDAAFAEAGIEAVAHLAFVMRQTRNRAEGRRINVGGAENVLRAAEAGSVRRIVALSSATVYGPRSGVAGMFTEDATPCPPKGFAYAEDKAECETLLERFQSRHPQCDVSILRSCVVMGPNAANFITSALDRPALIGISGDDPPMQFAHEDDLVGLLVRFIREPHPGIYNVAAPGSIPWSEVVALSGKRMLSLPAVLAHGLTQFAWLVRLQSDAPAVGLRFIRWPWTVSTGRLDAEVGHRFAYSSREALVSYLNARAPHSQPRPPRP